MGTVDLSAAIPSALPAAGGDACTQAVACCEAITKTMPHMAQACPQLKQAVATGGGAACGQMLDMLKKTAGAAGAVPAECSGGATAAVEAPPVPAPPVPAPAASLLSARRYLSTAAAPA